MFKRIPLRQFAPLTRPQIQRLGAQHGRRALLQRSETKIRNGQPMQVQRVRFVQPPLFSWRRHRKLIYYVAAFYVFFTYVLPEFVTISFEEVEEEAVGKDGDGEVVAEGEEEEEDGEEMGLFLPMSWPTKQERVFYRASDPEWKEFVKFSKETERHKDVQKRLVSAIRSEISSHPNSTRILGKIDPNKGRYWLEIIFPDGPPQEFEVKGIEITDAFIAWSSKTVSQKEYAQLYRTIVPTATIMASWATIKYHFDTQANKVRAYLGLPLKIDPEVAMIKAHLKERPHTKGLDGSPPPPATGKPQQGTISPMSASTSSASSANGSSAEQDGTEASGPKIQFPSVVPRGESKPVTLALFMNTLKKNRTSTPIEPPRGSVVVTGLIEVLGSRGRTTLDVSAAFDPKSDEYLLWSWKPRRIQPKSQRPRGGP